MEKKEVIPFEVIGLQKIEQALNTQLGWMSALRDEPHDGLGLIGAVRQQRIGALREALEAVSRLKDKVPTDGEIEVLANERIGQYVASEDPPIGVAISPNRYTDAFADGMRYYRDHILKASPSQEQPPLTEQQ